MALFAITAHPMVHGVSAAPFFGVNRPLRVRCPAVGGIAASPILIRDTLSDPYGGTSMSRHDFPVPVTGILPVLA